MLNQIINNLLFLTAFTLGAACGFPLSKPRTGTKWTVIESEKDRRRLARKTGRKYVPKGA